MEDFQHFFSDISNGLFDCVNDEAEHFCSTHFNLPNSRFPELDQPFTVDEIKLSVKRLKRNKAYGIDNILNEYLIVIL